jgi:hypothetical protein
MHLLHAYLVLEVIITLLGAFGRIFAYGLR